MFSAAITLTVLSALLLNYAGAEDIFKRTIVAPPPINCEEAMQRAKGRQSGIYRIQLPYPEQGIYNVFCLLDPKNNGSAWTVIQRRKDGSANFNRRWADYKRGFGKLEHEFFIGLDLLYQLTNNEKVELWIELKNAKGESRHAKYTLFAIDSEAAAYELTTLGDYYGNAGDEMTPQLHTKFSARDRKNAESSGSCAKYDVGAWWYKNCDGIGANLNGKYLDKPTNSSKDKDICGISWNQTCTSPIKYVHMAIRAIKLIHPIVLK